MSLPRTKKNQKKNRGFTLIELLVVIAIIGVLSSVILAALSTARINAYDADRFTQLRQIEQALDLYYTDHGSYPSTGSVWYSYQCTFPHTAVGSDSAVITGLTPTYISTIAPDPGNGGTDPSNVGCWAYYSNGTDYKVMDYNPKAGTTKLYNPGYTSPFVAQATNVAYGVWTSGYSASNP